MRSSRANQQQDPSSVKLPPRAHVPIARCRVQLLGRAAPTDSPDGLLAMQKPLFELYASYAPVESVIIAYTSGLVIRPPADIDDGAEELWFPIQELKQCGAVRPVGNPLTDFVPLSSSEARSSTLVAVFAFIVKRRDIPVNDCWAVECKSDAAATALVTACMMAHKNPAGWASAVDRPPSTISNKEVPAAAPPREEWDGAVAKESAPWNNKFSSDYYDKPPLQGFYYTPKPGLIQQYAISELNPEPDEEQEDEPPPGPIQPETAPQVQGHQPYILPGDAYYQYGVGGTPSQREPAVIYPDQTDLYRYPPLIYPEDVRQNQYRSSDSDVADGKDRHRKKKSKKSKKKKVPTATLR